MLLSGLTSAELKLQLNRLSRITIGNCSNSLVGIASTQRTPTDFFFTRLVYGTHFGYDKINFSITELGNANHMLHIFAQ